MDCSLPGSSLHGILQARVLEWVAISFSRGSSPPRNRTWVSRIAGRHFNLWATTTSRNHPHFEISLAEHWSNLQMGFPGGSEVKVSACNVGDLGSTPGSGRSPGEGNGNPLQYSCLENPMDRGAWWATVHGVAKSQTRLSNFTFHSLFSLVYSRL